MKKTLLFILCLFTSVTLFAQFFSSGDLNYAVLNATEARVAGTPGFTGVANIPSTVTDPGTGITYTVTLIGSNVFLNCTGLTAVNIPNTVTEIMSGAFYGCSGLTSVVIPNSVNLIGDNAFAFCFNLTSLTFNNATPVGISSNVFPVSSGTLYVPSGSETIYRSTSGWSNFGTVAAIPPATHLNFDGINDNIRLNANLSNILSNSTEFTIEYWFKGTTMQSGVRFQNGGGDYIIAGWGAGAPQFIISTDGGTNGVSCGPAFTINNNNWHHLAFVWKQNTTFATYLDGVLQDSRVAANVNLPNIAGTNGNIGSLNGVSEFLEGNIDDVRIWNKALSAADIAGRSACELVGNEAGLLAYYKFNIGLGGLANTNEDFLPDASPNGFSAPLNNFALTGNTSNWLAGSPVTTGSVIPATPTVTANQGFCGITTVANLLPATSATIKWYNVATGGSALLNGAPVNTGTYYVASVNANGCESSRVAVAVTVGNPNPPIANAQNFCTAATVANLVATGTGTFNWYNVATNGSPLASNTPLTSGAYYVSQVNGICESNRVFVSVTVDIANPPIASAQNFCTPTTVAGLTATGTGAIQWYNVAVGGSPLATTDALTSQNYYVSATVGICESARTQVAVTVGGAIAPSAISPQVYAGTANIASLNATGNDLKFYASATLGSSLLGNTALVDGTTYYVSQTIGTCESARTAILVRKISEATQTLCGPATVTNFVSTPTVGASTNWFTAITGGTALANNDAVTAGNYYVEQRKPLSVSTLASGFNRPEGIAVQADGKIVVADTENNVIKRMNADGTDVVTLGSGFSFPSAVAIQADGKIVVADNGNNAIKRINADGTGVVETLGSGFNSPYAVAIQADGKIVVTEVGRVKRMNADGTDIVVFGGIFEFKFPYGVAIQADGKIIVTDAGNNTVKRMNTDGSDIVTLSSGINLPTGVAVQADNKIVVTYGGGSSGSIIRRMDADGSNLVTLVTGFRDPKGIAIQTDGKFVVADSGNDAIKLITPENTSNRVAVGLTLTAPAAPTATPQVAYLLNATPVALTATGTSLLWYTTAVGGSGSSTPPTPSTNSLGTTSYWVSQSNTCESPRTKIDVVVTTPATHLNFDGVNDNISLSSSILDALSNGTETTIEYWFKGTNLQSAVRFQNGGDYVVAGWGAGAPQFIVSTDGETSGVSCGPAATINNNAWHHLAFVWKKNTIFATYLDGVLQNSRVAANVNLPPFSGVAGNIGSFAGTSEFLEGSIDDVRIWNVALSADDINRQKNCELSGNEIGLIAYYKFNHGLGGASNANEIYLLDGSINTNDSPLTGFALTGNSSNWLSGSPVITGSVILRAPTAVAQLFCSATTVANLIPAASATIKWYTTASGGVALTSTDPVSTATYYVAALNANGCESARTAVAITVDNAIAPTATTPQMYAGSATIASLTATGTNLKWYAAATLGSPLATNTTLVDGTTYYVSQTIGTCESARTAVVVTNSISVTTSGVLNTFSACSGVASASQSFTVEGKGLTANITITAPTNFEVSTIADSGFGATLSLAPLNGTVANTPIFVRVIATPTGATTGTVTCSSTGATTQNVAVARTATLALIPAYQIDIVCRSGNTGEAHIAPASGGVGPYTYNWTPGNPNGNGTRSITNLTAGTYTCTVTDAAGCTAAHSFIINQPAAGDVTGFAFGSQTNVSCYGGSDGEARLPNRIGFIYNWGPGNPAGDGTNMITGLTAGTWTCTVTNTFSGCSETATFIITQPAIVTAPTATTPQVYAGTATIASLTATGTNLKWYAAETLGSPLATNTTLVNGTTYYVSQTIGTCESRRTVVVAQKISEAMQTLCGSATVANFVSSPNVGATADWFTAISGGTALPYSTAVSTGTYYIGQYSPLSIATLGSGFNAPYGVAIQADGKIVVADYANGNIKRMNADGSDIQILGSGFDAPISVAIQPDGKILVGDALSWKIKRMDADGTRIVTLPGTFNTPYGIAVQADGKIVVANTGRGIITRMDADGGNLQVLGSRFNAPYGVAIQPDGKIIVGDSGKGELVRIDADGVGMETLSSGSINPYGVAIQADGKIVVVDIFNNAIRRMDTNGNNIETLASGFSDAVGLAIQADGKIVVGSNNNNAIKRITDTSISNRVAVSVTVNTAPAPTASAQSFCTATTVAGLTATGTGTINWYSVAVAGSPLATNTALATGTYYVSQTVNGCESARTSVAVTITPATDNVTTQTACTSYTWNGTTYTASGIYTGATANCITEKLNLTITPATDNTTTQTACTSYTWNGTTYTASGVYTGATANCVTQKLNLTIIPATDNVTTQTACTSYTWNGTTYTASGIYTGATANCVTQKLNLTIGNPVTPTGDASQIFTTGATLADIVTNSTIIAWYATPTDAATNTNQLAFNTVLIDATTYYGVNVIGTCSSSALAVTATVPPVLPLTLTSFTAKAVGTGNQINWTSASIINVKTITLERSGADKNFSALVTLPPNATIFIDVEPLAGDNYYRLSSTDNNGAKNTYNKIAIVKGLSKQISVYPNPVTNGVLNVVAGNNAIKSITVINLNGVKVISLPTVSNPKTVVVNTSSLIRGVYLLEIKDAQGTTIKKVVVN
ncbi:MAG: T9SS C-terminal target domain-containing protein [Sphingobacteriales bacterium]|nr:MAG: T9SS C-terminal target domain-containing protein [Sphingobacteriales bacterium]TAF78890.1 MAG: T9SS C-terminal target domain-containing protein [Sphingobacteriales bacterium]